jgi:hypothetical protein
LVVGAAVVRSDAGVQGVDGGAGKTAICIDPCSLFKRKRTARKMMMLFIIIMMMMMITKRRRMRIKKKQRRSLTSR